jgi:hypothetical protein
MASGKEGGRSRAPGTSIPSAAQGLILRAAPKDDTKRTLTRLCRP